MKAVVVHHPGDNPVLSWEEAPDPVIGAEEVIIRVRATAVNRADLLQAKGKYPPPPGASPIPGLEAAGEIAAVGKKVRSWKKGDRVCALLAGGGYAEKAAVHAQLLMGLPDGWSFAQGAAIPEAWLTGFVNLFLEGMLSPGESVLIHAGASGVGTASIQMARAGGATVYATAGEDFKAVKCRELGAVLVVNYRQRDFVSEVMKATSGQGVDLILDPVGAPYLAKNLELLRKGGRLVQIGLMGGYDTRIDLRPILIKNIRLIGSTLRDRPLIQKIRITRHFKRVFWPLFDGTLQPVIDADFPIEKAQDAHEYVAQNRNAGKVILLVGEEECGAGIRVQ